jgi:hypothetical protein
MHATYPTGAMAAKHVERSLRLCGVSEANDGHPVYSTEVMRVADAQYYTVSRPPGAYL